MGENALKSPMPNDLSRSVPKAILIGAIVAAVLDILDPILFYGLRGVAPMKIPQSIASGILGRASYSDGVPSVLLGLAAHLFIAMVWATLFVLAARAIPALARYAVPAGLLYGAFIYAVMYYLVLPHTALYPKSNPSGMDLANSIGAMVVLVGLPISLANRRFAPSSRLSSN
jgi:ABC-type enterochelin transport system permease subunit